MKKHYSDSNCVVLPFHTLDIMESHGIDSVADITQSLTVGWITAIHVAHQNFASIHKHTGFCFEYWNSDHACIWLCAQPFHITGMGHVSALAVLQSQGKYPTGCAQQCSPDGCIWLKTVEEQTSCIYSCMLPFLSHEVHYFTYMSMLTACPKLMMVKQLYYVTLQGFFASGTL